MNLIFLKFLSLSVYDTGLIWCRKKSFYGTLYEKKVFGSKWGFKWSRLPNISEDTIFILVVQWYPTRYFIYALKGTVSGFFFDHPFKSGTSFYTTFKRHKQYILSSLSSMISLKFEWYRCESGCPSLNYYYYWRIIQYEMEGHIKSQ